MSHNILVTGSRGFIGRHLLAKLQHEGHQVREFNRGDDIVDSIFAIDYVIHCAGLLYNKQPHDFWYDNVVLTHTLLRLAKQQDVKKFIYIGASPCYGKNDFPVVEVTPFKPRTLHEYTKAMGQMLCEIYTDIGVLDTYTAIPFSVYGPDDKPTKLFPALVNAVKNDKTIGIAKGVGHDWLYVDDFVDGIYKILDYCGAYHVFNFCTGINTTNEEVVNIFETVANTKINIYPISQHEYDNHTWVGDATLARRELKWSPQIQLEDGIRRCLKYV